MSCEVCYGSGCEHNCPCCNDYPENEEEENEVDQPENWDTIEDEFGIIGYTKH